MPQKRLDTATTLAIVSIIAAVAIATVATTIVFVRDSGFSPLTNQLTPPGFTLTDTIFPGAQWNLSSHLRDGRPILLEFIHTDCSACKNAVPDLKTIHNRYGASMEMVTIAITLDVQGFRNPPNVSMTLEFKNTYQTDWTYLAETQGTNVRDSYGVTSVPTFYLIGRDARIAYKQIGLTPGNAHALEDAIAEALR